MVTLRQRTTVATATAEPEPALKEAGIGDDLIILEDDSSPDSAVKHLRGRWELASVLNFLNVFSPILSDKLKLKAEEIETGLIECNTKNAQLHIALLKGIPPVHKLLDDGDAWITLLCKKLAPYWSWIAQGEIPVTANKGEEVSEYKGLDPVDRLRFLKALCELRVDQGDARTHIQENAKEGAWDSSFRKRKLGGDGKKTAYWFDGNDIQGYRLYREVTEISKNAKARKNESSDVSNVSWETEATNLDQFQRAARELTSNKASSLAAIGQMIETDAIPVVEKYHKKIEKAIKRKMKQERVFSVNFSRPIRTTRSCRNRVPASYTFEEYDKMISEAVEETEEIDQGDEEGMVQHSPPLGSNDSSEGNNVKSTEYVAIAEEVPESGNDDEKENENEKSKVESEGKMEFSAKNRLRQRVTRNSALC